MRPMYGQRIAAAILTLVLLSIAIGAAAYGFIVFATLAKEILVSVIAGVASLLAVVFTYVFQRARELELASIVREKDLELAQVARAKELEMAERKLKQENYARILERLAPFVRQPDKAGDDFTTAYLYTWICGSADVVVLTNTFLKERNFTSLDNLLKAMRREFRLDNIKIHNVSLPGFTNEIPSSITSENLFPRPPAEKVGTL
jgi:hypothetical protein